MYVKLENEEPPTQVEASTEPPLDITTTAHYVVDPSEPSSIANELVQDATTSIETPTQFWYEDDVDKLKIRILVGMNHLEKVQRDRIEKIFNEWKTQTIARRTL
jgi:hypothetical protein